MKWKDSSDSVDLDDEGGKDPYAGKSFSFKSGNVSAETAPGLFQQFKMPLVFVAAGLLVLTVLVFLFIPGKKTSDVQQINALESKIKVLENRLSKIEKVAKAATVSADQKRSIAELKRKVDGLEAVLTKQIDNMAIQLAALKKSKASVIPPAKTPAPRKNEQSGQGSKPAYHVVQTGENLYRISLRYGLKMDALLRLNNLEPGTVIRPGQRLKVSP